MLPPAPLWVRCIVIAQSPTPQVYVVNPTTGAYGPPMSLSPTAVVLVRADFLDQSGPTKSIVAQAPLWIVSNPGVPGAPGQSLAESIVRVDVNVGSEDLPDHKG